MNKYMDVCVVIDKYTDNTGKERNKYQTVGFAIIADDGKISLKLEKWFNPAGVTDMCWLSFFERKSKKSQEEEVPF